MLFGVPTEVKTFFAPVTRGQSKPIRKALAAMVLAFTLAPHRRSLKTVAQEVAEHHCHPGTISRRLVNAKWQTWNWYVLLSAKLLEQTDRWERHVAGQKKRQWTIVIDPTYHGTLSKDMENLILMSSRKDPRRRQTRQHVFVMGMVLTDRGGRFPLPRKSYYTKEYCQKYKRQHRTQVQLAAEMLAEVRVPEGVEVTVVFDSALDAGEIHKVCRRRGFRAVFPLDPNRVLAAGDAPESEGLPGQKVVAWARSWKREEFALIELQVDTEDHVLQRRRHVDNLRVKKTHRRYAVAARRASVSKLGDCLIVASYKENPKVELLPGQSAHWWAYHTPEVPLRKRGRPSPARWHGKVLACTDLTATPQQVVQWYELRWQVELFFRELKSRLQFGRYVLMKFEAVERYVDLLMMGMLLLEKRRLKQMQQAGSEAGTPWVQARATDQLRDLGVLCQEWNAQLVERLVQTERGRRRLLKMLREAPGRLLPPVTHKK